MALPLSGTWFLFHSLEQEHAGSNLAMYCLIRVQSPLEILNMMVATCNFLKNIRQDIYHNINWFSFLAGTQDPGLKVLKWIDWPDEGPFWKRFHIKWYRHLSSRLGRLCGCAVLRTLGRQPMRVEGSPEVAHVHWEWLQHFQVRGAQLICLY